MSKNSLETIVLGGGCFWCTEAVFKRVPGVTSVAPGYAGGVMENPQYQDVSAGSTGHAEVVKVTFDKEKVSLRQILEIFFLAHDPTTLNRQGGDIGTQYRSIILFTDINQKPIIEKSLKTKQNELKDKIVTEVKPLEKFYSAEESHRNYYENHRNSSYCVLVIQPKLDKIFDEQ